MAIRPEEITSILEQELQSFERKVDEENIGTVLQVGDGIARVYGLPNARMGEMLEFPGGVFGLALNLEEDSIGAVLIGEDAEIKEGDTVRQTGRIIEVPVGKELLGRVVNALGQPLDGAGAIPAKQTQRVEVKAPGVVQRQPVVEPLQTGIKAIDAMIPIGRGQRELIIGDRQTGKTTIATDTIINQRQTHEPGGSPVYCIYVAVGQKMANIARVVETLKGEDALKYTIIVTASASDAAAEQYLAPFAGAAIGEYFRDNGMHALVIYDDLSKHAAAYRTLSLLLRRPPGREAFPGDVFFLHSRLLERAAKKAQEFVVVPESEEPSRDKADQIWVGDIEKENAEEAAKEKGQVVKMLPDSGGSLTALPIIETQAGDVSAYIPTNVISITDGQIYLEPDLFFAGVRPAINVGISVSRVGGNAQVKAMKQVAGRLKLEMSQYRDVQAFAQFASDLDKATQRQLLRGQRLTELLKQDIADPYLVVDQILTIYAGTNGFADEVKNDEVQEWERGLIKFVHDEYPDCIESVASGDKMSDDLQKTLKKAFAEYNEKWFQDHDRDKGFGAGS